MFKKEDAIKIAKIGKIFGLNGELTLRLYDTFPDDVDFQEPLFVYINGLLVPLFIKSFSKKGNNKAVVVFDDIDSQYRATEFIGADVVAFSQEDLAEAKDEDDDNIYFEDFIGYSFEDQVSEKTGNIVNFIDHKFNPIFAVELNEEEFYIPANDDMIIEIDTTNRKITFSLPDGIFDINN